MTTRPRFLLFSGHNERAVVALCRYFARARLDWVIVAAGRDDAILATAYRERVRFVRADRRVDAELLRALGGLAGTPLVYCPTTEFINDVLLAQREALAGSGLVCGLPPASVYRRLTSKLDSQALFDGLPGVSLPRRFHGWPTAPCVFKPRRNVEDGRVLYPLLCPTDAALQQALARPGIGRYFAQAFVPGQSYYLCAYLARDGRRASMWQENLMQQPDGKSIVLARSVSNPGLDEAALFERLRAAGCHGPLMIEFIRSDDGTLHYIETNPRFWGPLQLALDACPAILELFVQDHGDTPRPLSPPAQAPHVYGWSAGARVPGTVVHPAGAALPDALRLLAEHDVYARPDTQALHATH
jgi:hypothetical protein